MQKSWLNHIYICLLIALRYNDYSKKKRKERKEFFLFSTVLDQRDVSNSLDDETSTSAGTR
jgi:hypothetical protein